MKEEKHLQRNCAKTKTSYGKLFCVLLLHINRSIWWSRKNRVTESTEYLTLSTSPICMCKCMCMHICLNIHIINQYMWINTHTWRFYHCWLAIAITNGLRKTGSYWQEVLNPNEIWIQPHLRKKLKFFFYIFDSVYPRY